MQNRTPDYKVAQDMIFEELQAEQSRELDQLAHVLAEYVWHKYSQENTTAMAAKVVLAMQNGCTIRDLEAILKTHSTSDEFASAVSVPKD